jgi:hypothetical protein
MDKLCGGDVASGSPPILKLQKTDFLGRGGDAAGKADFQGCGEFNPALIFSKQEERKFAQQQDKTERNAANAPNRRVMALLFRKGSVVDPAKWPCPRASEGVAGCRKRFFSDGDHRRSKQFPDLERKAEVNKDTFACRFYDRLTTHSPCAQLKTLIPVRIVPEVFVRCGNVMAFAERLDGKPFKDVEKVSLGGREVDFAFSAPNGRLFFFPPADGSDPLAQGTLPETGEFFKIVTPVQYTEEMEAVTQSLRRQMDVLRQCGEQFAAFMGLMGHPELASSAFDEVTGDGELRLADALDCLDQAAVAGDQVEAGSRSGPFDALFAAMGQEYGPAMDRFDG